jgi:hypothetical protein
MAEAAWTELQIYNRADDVVETIAIQETTIELFKEWTKPAGDFYTDRGVKTFLRLADGSQYYSLETYQTLTIKMKVKK